MNSRTTIRLLPALLAAAAFIGLLGTTMASANNDLPPECSASATTLVEAKTNYANNCTLPRIDCDKIDGLWYCSSRVIGNAAPGGITSDDVGASAIGTITVTNPPTTQPPTTQPPTTQPPTTQPPATEPPTTEPPVTQPPATQPPTTEPPATTEPPVTEPPTTQPPATEPPATQPPADVNCGVIAIEAESLGTTGAWRLADDNKASGGRYLTWEGLSPSRNNNAPADVLSTTITISKTGSYRFTWAMRQPDGVESDKANDSWLNFPDADRFGPTGGGSYPGFIKVFGNSKGDFSYSGTADVNHKKSTIAIEFNQTGTYTMEIAGRSHGHQLDRIVLYHESIGKNDAVGAPNGGCDQPAPPTTTPTPTPTTAPAPAPTTVPTPTPICAANSSGKADLSKDLISLQYDHAPDRDDGHATAAGREVATELGFSPWVIGGAYGADNARTYRSESEAVMDAVWGSGNWINADADWQGAVTRTADRWQQTLENCGDIWIAEGGQSDLSADIVRELKNRMPNLDTNRRIHLVQHSNWNEEKALDADLRYVKDNTDYIRIPDGNGGGNGTADFNDQNYRGPFIDLALNGPHGAGWRAAFDYYSPQNARLDFSDTVELLEILDINTDQVNNIEDFADVFMR